MAFAANGSEESMMLGIFYQTDRIIISFVVVSVVLASPPFQMLLCCCFYAAWPVYFIMEESNIPVLPRNLRTKRQNRIIAAFIKIRTSDKINNEYIWYVFFKEAIFGFFIISLPPLRSVLFQTFYTKKAVHSIRNAIYCPRTGCGTEPFQCARKLVTDVVQL